MERTNRNGLANITYGLILVTLIGWLLVIGESFALPILVALVSVYIMGAIDDFLGRVPILRWFPSLLRRAVLALGFVGILAGFGILISNTVQELAVQAPKYQENIEKLVGQAALWWGFERAPDWETIKALTLEKVNITGWLSPLVSQVGSISGTVFMIVVYIMFLLGEKAQFPFKLAVAFPDAGKAQQTRKLIADINSSIGQYLATKTLVSTITGLTSFVILLAFGVDYAAFWALLIGLLDFIPYIGAAIGLLLPVLLSIVQFASWPVSLGIYAALQVAQIVVSNFIEPKLVGKKVNLSAFVVLVALALWSAIWGIPGAILAVPLTSILVIIFKELPAMRPLAVFMSNDPSSMINDDPSQLLDENANRPDGRPTHYPSHPNQYPDQPTQYPVAGTQYPAHPANYPGQGQR